jgi:hypothetical protein
MEWWTNHKGFNPLPLDAVIPVLSAMQGHLESPCLWEKHADAILRDVGLTPTTHKLCLYSGIIDDKRVLLKRQVDDFAIAVPDVRTTNILLGMIDNYLFIPVKRQGYLVMYNGVNVTQTRYYIKISCATFINKVCQKYLYIWMKNYTSTSNRPTPLPTDPA